MMPADTVMHRLRREAARQHKNMSELLEAALRLLFHERKGARTKKLRPLPTFNGGKPFVHIADRNALYDAIADCDVEFIALPSFHLCSNRVRLVNRLF